MNKSLDYITPKSNTNFQNSSPNYEFQNSLQSLIDTPVNEFMDKTKTMSESITPSFDNDTSTNSFFSIKNILLILLIIFILAFFGYNIFTYLSYGTNFITDLLKPVFTTTGEVVSDATKSTISTTSTGTKKIIDTTGDTTKNIVDVAETGTTSSINYLQNKLKNKTNKQPIQDEEDIQPEPHRTSSLQQGYCYIGKINDARRCAKVNERMQCMSGDIYPTMDICINPNLRV